MNVKIIRALRFIVLCVALLPRPVFASALSTLANSMSPGQWAAFSTNGFNNGAIGQPSGGSIAEYTDKGRWNPVAGQGMVMGGQHGADLIYVSRVLIYDEASNTWSAPGMPANSTGLPLPSGAQVFPNFDDAFFFPSGCGSSIPPCIAGGMSHGFQEITVNTNTGDFYHRQSGTGKTMRYTVASGTWSQCSVQNSGHQVAGAIEYFPDRNSLVYLDGDWGVWELDLSSGNCLSGWVQRASGAGGGFSPQLGVSGYSNQSAYSPYCHCLVLGAGGTDNHTLYRYMPNGTFQTVNMTNGPSMMRVPGDGVGSVFTYDPAGGKILVWSYTNANSGVYEYDGLADTWTFVSTVSPEFPSIQGTVQNVYAIPISNYGVIMFVDIRSGGGGRIYLYKHGAAAPDTTPPSNPSSLTASTISSTQINLAWTASTDNIAVTGYLVERCQGASCSNFAQVANPNTNSYPNTGLTASTSYSYRVRATDGSNNLSGYSNTSSATTGAPDTTPPTAPSNLVAIAQSSSSVGLTWNTSTDNVAVTNYLIERCAGVGCANFAQVATSTIASYTDSLLTASTSHSYRVRATDAANNLSSYSNTSTATTAATGSDFATRCAAPGVIRCFSFDTDADFYNGAADFYGAYGHNFGVMPAYNSQDYSLVTRDSTVKATGISSMRFKTPGTGTTNNTVWFTNLSPDLTQQVGEGEEIYIQFRYRADPNFVNQVYAGSTGFKIMDLSGGDSLACPTTIPANTTECPSSCWDGEVVFTTTKNTPGQRDLLELYGNCSGPYAYGGFTGPGISLQNVVGCFYPTYPEPPCWYLTANEWWTFQIHLKVGHWNAFDSIVQLWVAHEGQPSQLIIECSPTYHCEQDGDQPGVWLQNNTGGYIKTGKIWLEVYQTGGNYSGLQDGYAWFDDLIISRQKIADPGFGTTPPGAAEIQNLRNQGAYKIINRGDDG